ncbi:MAG: hypothetical protein WC819_03690 [Parcubacteria group bacterium]
MPYNPKHDKAHKKERQEARFYRMLSLVSIAIMVIAAYTTYGQQKREILISPEPEKEKVAAESQHVDVTGDLSLVPSDKELKKILNKVLPDTCKDCDDAPLDCLDRYEMNKALMTGEHGESILSVEVITGKASKEYLVMIDLSHNNTVIKKGGEIDKKECLETEEEDGDVITDAIYVDRGDDPDQSDHVTVD